MSDITDAIRDAVKTNDDVLNGALVVEVLSERQPRPTLQYYEIGDPSPWHLAGMLHAMARAVDASLDAGHEPDESE